MARPSSVIEDRRGIIEHDVPNHVLEGSQILATAQQASRLICRRHGNHEDDGEPGGWYSVREDQATARHWDQIVLRVNPELITPQDAAAFLFGRKVRRENGETIDVDF